MAKKNNNKNNLLNRKRYQKNDPIDKPKKIKKFYIKLKEKTSF